MSTGHEYYFDYAAATPLDAEVFASMQPFFSQQFYNPSANYEPARQVRTALDDARKEVAHVLGAKPLEIVFTAGGTEANNIAIHGVMQLYPEGNMVLSAIEHDSVRAPAGKYRHKTARAAENGIVDLDDLRNRIDDQTVLVSVMFANNEIGTIQPIREIGIMIERKRKARQKTGNTLPLLLHVDAAQAGNYLDIHVHRLGADLMTLNGGKIYGPKQSGVLYVRSGVILHPVIVGGGQERGLRSGTEHVAACVGFAKALSAAQSMKSKEAQRLYDFQKLFYDELSKIPGVTINGSKKHRLPNNVHITIKGQDNERLLILLDQKQIYAAAGSACSASHDEPSHVLTALGKDESAIRGSLRITMGRFTSEASVRHFAAELASILA